MTANDQEVLRASLRASTAIAGNHPAIAQAEKTAVRFWGYLAGAVMLGGLIVAFFGGWYWALIGIAVGLAIAEANRRSAAQVVLKTANGDPVFKEEMLQRGILMRV